MGKVGSVEKGAYSPSMCPLFQLPHLPTSWTDPACGSKFMCVQPVSVSRGMKRLRSPHPSFDPMTNPKSWGLGTTAYTHAHTPTLGPLRLHSPNWLTTCPLLCPQMRPCMRPQSPSSPVTAPAAAWVAATSSLPPSLCCGPYWAPSVWPENTSPTWTS